MTLTTNLQLDYGYYPWNQNGGRLQALKGGTPANPSILQDLRYSYDAVGNITQVVNAKAPETQSFTYDALDRLVAANLPAETYSYDALGNLTNKNGTYTYSTNPTGCAGGNGPKPHAVSNAAGLTLTYDCNGNVTQRVSGSQTFNLAYDAENRLVSVSGAASANYRYAGDGTRIVSIQGSVTTLYTGNYYEWASNGTVKKYY